MKLIADSGSTKTDWCVMDGSRVVQRMAGHQPLSAVPAGYP